jgi:drug/metabolite transporter (DMT)-like permease
MTDFPRDALSLRWISGATVFLVAWIIGSKAAEGMNPVQWTGAVAALAAAIAWAVIEQVWPAARVAEPADRPTRLSSLIRSSRRRPGPSRVISMYGP